MCLEELVVGGRAGMDLRVEHLVEEGEECDIPNILFFTVLTPSSECATFGL